MFSEGFREGGTNSTGFGNLIIIPEEFESDSIENYEIGAKTVPLSVFTNRPRTIGASISWSF